MALRIKYIAAANGKQVKIRGRDEHGQYVIEFYEWNEDTSSFTQQAKADYFTDDWSDAINTANHFLGLPYSNVIF
jgi:hypothetical protein